MIPLIATDPALSAFGHDPWWISLLKAFFIFVVLVLLTLFNIWLLRRVMARMQHRLGPNVHGPFGLLQSLADGVKLALKEDLMPTKADKVVFLLAPVLIVVPAFVTWAVIPFGPEVNFFGHHTPLQLTDMPVAVLFVLAIASIGVYGIVLGGWSGGSTYSLLGGLRSSAQMISYEVPMGLALVAVFMYSGSMSTSQIVAAQSKWWYVVILLPSFLMYFVSMLAETNSIPFDLPEAEGELVGGYHTEYSSLKFALFFLAEFINKITAAAVVTTLFLGGWHAPFGIEHVWAGANSGYWPLLWFFAKVYLFIFIFAWIMATLPRFRYDQLMHLGWRWLIPLSLAWIVLVAAMRVVTVDATVNRTWIYIGLAIALVVLLGAMFVADRKPAVDEEVEDRANAPRPGGFPVPAMPAGGPVRGAAASLQFGGPRFGDPVNTQAEEV